MFEEASKPFWLSCRHPDKWLPSGRSTGRGSEWSLPSAAAGHILSSLQIAILLCLKGNECLPGNVFTKVKPDTIYAAFRTRARSGKHSINISCCCCCAGFLLLLLSLCHGCGSSQPPRSVTFATSQVLDHGGIGVTLKIGSPEHMCSLLLHIPTPILTHSLTDPGSSQVECRVRVGVVSC